MPCPVFEGGDKLVMQRGVGMCTVKSTPEREQACITFLKWLTEPACNVEFVTSLGYMPVTQEAFEKYLPNAVEKLSNPLYVSLYETYLQMQEAYLVRLKLTAWRTQYLEGGNTLDALIWETLESFKLDYGT